jgi:hypothetical protein
VSGFIVSFLFCPIPHSLDEAFNLTGECSRKMSLPGPAAILPRCARLDKAAQLRVRRRFAENQAVPRELSSGLAGFPVARILSHTSQRWTGMSRLTSKPSRTLPVFEAALGSDHHGFLTLPG